MNDCLLDYRRGNDISGEKRVWRQKRTEGSVLVYHKIAALLLFGVM